MTSEIRQLLRSAKVFHPDLPDFDTDAAPDEPMTLFVEWLTAAIDGGVGQPHAMTLSTSDRAGAVTARTLLLKDVDDAFWFATSSLSPKGRQLRENPRVALTLFWREQGRQIRICGEASPGPRDVSTADFTARHPDSRAVAIAMPQSSPVDDPAAADAALDAAKTRIADDDEFAPDDWTAFRVAPMQVEFWQATTGRDQVRLRYDRTDPSSWAKSVLWP
ncbi:pyridoxamine 5'-phosphate oxidase [Frondihabitans sp. PhB188]|uniref:pyridoxine/pyridoxamine 5'-phosphate oxidase n=1 Tax=Frondihabitans sp. PhB188 TaxID=2485200 RepID=UPI000F4988F2|nr:pyridoxal 5'-phosphate synthase [Frondihabitans sp. PhB188]ROQ41305.1 pyridoxamine 5'-phosphate oxidase [Frondihabitans sp. PhB188]